MSHSISFHLSLSLSLSHTLLIYLSLSPTRARIPSQFIYFPPLTLILFITLSLRFTLTNTHFTLCLIILLHSLPLSSPFAPSLLSQSPMPTATRARQWECNASHCRVHLGNTGATKLTRVGPHRTGSLHWSILLLN